MSVHLVTALTDRGTVVRYPAKVRDSSLLQSVQICPGTLQCFYSVDTIVSFPGGKTAETWTLTLNSIFRRFSQNCEKRLLASSCMSVCPSAWSNSVRTGQIFMKFEISGFFRKSREKIQVSLTSDKNNEHSTWRPMHTDGSSSLNSS
jgi:hypothetical protein